jgi:glutamate/tyrosine decarboxylase-like PLP-dependent enzyme
MKNNKEILREKLLQLELISRNLEPSDDLRKKWTDKSNSFASEFINSLPKRKAFSLIGNQKDLFEIEDKIDQSHIFSDIIDYLEKHLITQGLNPASGGHLGYIPGGGIYSGVLGDYLAALTNQYAGIFYGGPAAVKMENVLIRWMCKLMGYPAGSHGNLASGGSIANLIALVTAKEAKQIRSAEIPTLCIYLTEQVHHCIHKAIRICGLSEATSRFIPMDNQYRMDTEALEIQIRSDRQKGLNPFLVVASAGTTDTGAIDPLDKIADIAENEGLWFHIDAAYGGFFILCQEAYPDGRSYREVFKGIERSDSLVIDPHKGLFLSYGLGAVLVKDTTSLYKAHYYKAAYMQDTLSSQDELSPADLSPELTKHFRGLRLWLPLKVHGIQPFRACLDEKILLCRYFYERVQELGFETGPYPETSVCIYRHIPAVGDANEWNQYIVNQVLNNGRVFVSSTSIDGIFWLRLAILSFRTHLEIVNDYLALLTQIISSPRNGEQVDLS